MKALLYVLSIMMCFSIIPETLAQYNQWGWMKGDTVPDATHVWGTQGVASLANTPGAKYEASHWTDLQGNFWIFGGVDITKSSSVNNWYNDLWKYDPNPSSPTYNQWTWVNGGTSGAAVYGTQGIDAIGNIPPTGGSPYGIDYGACTWTDPDGKHLWLWGGGSNDMWRYDIQNNTWAWMHGGGPSAIGGNWGTLGVEDPANIPMPRSETSCSWVDQSGNLWMFGGMATGMGSYSYNDLWRYNTSTNAWTWMGGDQTYDMPGVYGTSGVAAATNKPGGRFPYASWTDSKGKFWMYGGGGGNVDWTNDVWMYDPLTNLWTWYKGGTAAFSHDPESDGTKCVSSPTNQPNAGREARARWIDDCDNLFVWDYMHNLLWKYSTGLNEWVWVSGNNVGAGPQVAGVKGTQAPANVPGFRMGANGFRYKSDIWMFGGYLYGGTTNELWKYTPSKPDAVFTPSTNSGCKPLAVNFTDNSQANCGGDIKSYAWDFGDGSTSSSQNPTHTFTSVGTFNVKLVVLNCFGIKDSTTQTMTVNSCLCSLSAQTTINSNVKCNGGTDGAASVTANGGTGPYTCSWSSGSTGTTTSTTISATGLAAATYTVTITDGACSSTSTVVITQPLALNITSITPNNAVCSSNAGSANASATGGTGVITYSWSNGSTGPTASNLLSGTYTLIVTDGNSCTKTQSVSISNTPAPAINSVTVTNPLCNNGTGSATANASGGTGTLTYTWSNGGTTLTEVNLTAGTYSVTVNDANNCLNVSTVTISDPVSITASVSSTNTTCNLNNGTATLVSLSGGTGAMNYTWSTGEKTPVINNLANGTYTLSVTDANGCTKQFTTTVVNSNTGTVTAFVQTPISCNGLSTGAVQATITGGAKPYTYTWSNGTTGTTTGGVTGINSLPAGTYVVTVADAIGCLGISTITLTEPTALQVTVPTINNATCGNSNGSATASATGGGGGYIYSWSNGSTTQGAISLSAGTYTLNVTDANNCSQTTTVTIVNSNGPLASTAIQNTIACYGGTGSVAVTVSSGIAPYTYNWSSGATSVTSGLISQISNVIADTYTVTITDANACSIVKTINISAPSALTLSAANKTSTCGLSNGVASANATSGTAGYSYSWSNGMTGDTIKNVSANAYTVTATDANGCTTTASTIVGSIGAGAVNISPAMQTIVEGNSVVVTVSGGVSYTWTPAAGLSCSTCSNPVATPAVSTIYTVTTTDISGCVISGQLAINVKPACVGDDQDVFIPNVFSPNGDGKNDLLNIGGNGLTNIYWAIYDRWGNMLFEAFDQNHPWDGSVKGNPMETGTYVYYLKATCIKTNAEVKLKGNVTIIK